MHVVLCCQKSAQWHIVACLWSCLPFPLIEVIDGTAMAPSPGHGQEERDCRLRFVSSLTCKALPCLTSDQPDSFTDAKSTSESQ